MGKEIMRSAIRNEVIDTLINTLSEHYDSDVLQVSASAIVMPAVDAEGNECFVKISISVPRGTRNGEGGYNPYDGYAEHEDWKLAQQDKLDKENARKAKAEHAEKERERKRAARKVIKELNKKGLDGMIKEGE